MLVSLVIYLPSYRVGSSSRDRQREPNTTSFLQKKTQKNSHTTTKSTMSDIFMARHIGFLFRCHACCCCCRNYIRYDVKNQYPINANFFPQVSTHPRPRNISNPALNNHCHQHPL